MGLAGGFLLVAGLMALCGPGVLRAPLVAVANHYLRPAAGIEISVAALDRISLSRLELRGLRTLPAANAVVSFQVDHLTLHYSLSALLAGRESFFAGLSLASRGGRLAIDLTVPADPASPSFFFLPSPLPSLDLRDLDFRCRWSGGEVGAARLSLGAAPGTSAGGQTLCVATEGFRADMPWLRPYQAPLTARLRASGQDLWIDSLTLAGRELIRTAHCQFPLQPAGPVLIDADLQIGRGSLGVKASLADQAVAASFRLADLDAGRLAAFLVNGPQWTGRMNGGGDVAFNPADPAATLAATARLMVAEGSVAGQPLPELELAASAAAGRLLVERAAARLGPNSLTVTGLAVPLAALRAGWPALAADLELQAFAVDLADLPAVFKLFSAPAQAVSRLPQHHRLTLSGTLRQGVLAIAAGGLTADSGRITIRAARFGVAALARGWAAMELGGDLAFSVADLASFGALLGRDGLAGQVRGQVTVAGTMGRPRGQLRLSGQGLSWRGMALGRLAATVRGDGHEMVVEQFSLRHDKDQVAITAAVDLEKRELIRSHATLAFREISAVLAPWLPASWLPTGRLEAEVRGAGPLAGPAVTARIILAHCRVQGMALERAEADIAWRDGELRVDAARLAGRVATLSLAGAGTGLGGVSPAIRLDRLHIAGSDWRLALQGPAGLARQPDGGWRLAGCVLDGTPGRLTLAGTYGPHGELDFRAVIANASSKGWLAPLAGEGVAFAGLAGTVTLTGTIVAPRWQVAATVSELAIRGLPEPLAGRLDVACTDQGLVVRELAFRSSSGQQLDASGHLPLDPLAERPLLVGPIDFRARVELPEVRRLLKGGDAAGVESGALQATLALNGTWLAPRARLRLDARQIVLPDRFAPLAAAPLSLACDLDLTDNRLLVKSLRLDSELIRGTASGSWSDLPPLPQLLSGRAGRLRGMVAGQGTVRSDEIGWLAAGNDTIRRLAGSLRGGFQFSGPVADPEFSGTMELGSGQLRLAGVEPAISEMQVVASVVRLELCVGE